MVIHSKKCLSLVKFGIDSRDPDCPRCLIDRINLKYGSKNLTGGTVFAVVDPNDEEISWTAEMTVEHKIGKQKVAAKPRILKAKWTCKPTIHMDVEVSDELVAELAEKFASFDLDDQVKEYRIDKNNLKVPMPFMLDEFKTAISPEIIEEILEEDKKKEARQGFRNSMLDLVNSLEIGENDKLLVELSKLVDEMVPAEEVNLPSSETKIQSYLNTSTIGQLKFDDADDRVIKHWDGKEWKPFADLHFGLIDDAKNKEKECLTDPITSSVHAARTNIPSDFLSMLKMKKSTPASISITGNLGGLGYGQLQNTSSDILANTGIGIAPSSTETK